MEFLAILFCICLTLCVLFVIGAGCFLLVADADATLLLREKFGRVDHLAGQVAWITGASSGIGECLAQDLSALGVKLAISGTRVAKLEEVKESCLKHSSLKDDDILVLPFKIEDFEIHDKLVKEVIDHFGHIDILVNNAGISQKADFQDIEIEVDQKIFNINVFGAVNLTRKVLKHFLQRQKGQIIVNSSLAGKLGAPFSSSYTGTKHALHGYFEALRTETIQTKISVTIVCPGPVFSELFNRCFSGKPGEVVQRQLAPTSKKMPTKRCSQLMVVAIANKLDECWISLPPLLATFYLAQYAPSFFRNVVLKRYATRDRVEALRRGQN